MSLIYQVRNGENEVGVNIFKYTKYYFEYARKKYEPLQGIKNQSKLKRVKFGKNRDCIKYMK